MFDAFSEVVSLTTSSQHCYVSGGTAGLGLALALKLVKEGANVSVIARNQERLDKAQKEMEVRF